MIKNFQGDILDVAQYNMATDNPIIGQPVINPTTHNQAWIPCAVPSGGFTFSSFQDI
ncbi:hypothetical protein PQX77_017673 [Marasmius sp. AFHP31]|nr:hypothetical protein PQX77_017673 [Marasmius sp. AFHP31]